MKPTRIQSTFLLVLTCAHCGPSNANGPTSGTTPIVDVSVAEASSIVTLPARPKARPPLRNDNETRELLARFTASDWNTVEKAAREIEARDDAPDLAVSLLDRTDRAELTSTADLIYPGAKTFAGHGVAIMFDLDSIAGRAGWILEDVTFRTFGFASSSFETGRGPLPRNDEAIAKARAFWAENAATYSRYGAMQDALASGEPARVSAALQWMRYPAFPCPGFDRARYDAELRPLVERAARSPDASVAHIADLLLQEGPGRAIALSKPSR